MPQELQVITLEPKSAATASVIWLHGLGADGHDFEPIVPALNLPSDHAVRFKFPHAPIRPITINGGMEMRGWYDITQQGLDREVDEQGIAESAEGVASIISDEMAAGISSRQIVLAGFSQGGAIALHLGLRFEHRLAGILALSTYLPNPERLASEAHESNRDCPIFVGHGRHDPLVPETFGEQTTQVLGDAGYSVEYKTYPMEHAVSAEEISDIAVWLKRVLAID